MRVLGITAGEQMTGSPIWPRSGGPSTGEPKVGLQLWLSVHDEQVIILWLLRSETQSKSPGKWHGSAGTVIEMLLGLFLLGAISLLPLPF